MTIDVSPESKRYVVIMRRRPSSWHRATILTMWPDFRTNNVFMVFIPELITGIIGPPIGAWLLSWNLWATLICGTLVLFFTFAVMAFLPGEISERGKLDPVAADADPAEYEPLWQNGRNETTDSTFTRIANADEENTGPPVIAGSRKRLWAVHAFDELAEVVHGVLSFPFNKNVALALASVVVSTSSQIDDILLPFLSIMYHWSLAQVRWHGLPNGSALGRNSAY